MATLSQLIARASSANQLSKLLESDKFGIISILSYANGDTIYDGTTDCYDALVDAVADLPTSGGEIFFPSTANGGTYYLGTSKTLSANCTLRFADGAKIKPANGVVLTGTNTKLQAGLHHIFDLSLGGTIAGTWDMKEVYPQWFGAVKDGTTVDKTAFDKMFAFCTSTHIKAYIPKGTYNIATPLAEIGEYSITSTENGNFIIEGECEHDTVLLFALQNDSDVAFKIKENSAGWDISNFRLVNSNNKGVGFYFDKIYKSSVKNLQAIYFDIGVKKESYIANFTNVNGTNCHCGIYDLGGTSTINIACYGASNTIPVGDVRDLAGCGFYIEASDYNKYISCASDSNVTAYKVKTSVATYLGYTSDTLEFDNCGCESCTNAYYIDAKSADISIKRPTIYDITSGILAHVENASNVNIVDYTDCVYQGVSRGTNVGAGVIKMITGGYNTGGNPANYPAYANQNTVQHGIKGIEDFNYDGINFEYAGFTNGKMLKMITSLEFKLYARTNGLSAGATINVLPMWNYTGADIDRGGVINIGIFNGSGTLFYSLSTTNAAIKVTLTKIVESTVERGYQVLIEPFDGLTYASSCAAIFNVSAFASPRGADGKGKDHNVKEVGDYSGRTNILLKDVDY